MTGINKEELVLEIEPLTAVVVAIDEVPGYRVMLIQNTKGVPMCVVAHDRKIQRVLEDKLDALFTAVEQQEQGVDRVMETVRQLWWSEVVKGDRSYVDSFDVYVPNSSSTTGSDYSADEMLGVPVNMGVHTFPFNEVKLRNYFPGSSAKGIVRSLFWIYNEALAENLFGTALGRTGVNRDLPRSKVIFRDSLISQRQLNFVITARWKPQYGRRLGVKKYSIALVERVETDILAEEKISQLLYKFTSEVKRSYLDALYGFVDEYGRGSYRNSWLFKTVIPELISLNSADEGIVTLMGLGGLGLLNRLVRFVSLRRAQGGKTRARIDRSLREKMPTTGEVIISPFRSKKDAYQIKDQLGLVRLKIRKKQSNGEIKGD